MNADALLVKPVVVKLLSVLTIALMGVVVWQAVLIAHTRNKITGQPLLQDQDPRGPEHHYPRLFSNSVPEQPPAPDHWMTPSSESFWQPLEEMRLLQSRIREIIHRNLTQPTKTPDWSQDASGSQLAPPLPPVPMPPDFDQLVRVQREIDELFLRANEDFAQFGCLVGFDDSWQGLHASPAMNLTDDGSNYVVTVDLPRVDRDRIQVRIDGRLLSIVAKQSESLSNQTTTVRSTRLVQRRIELPGPIAESEGQTQASYAAGRLTVVVAKAQGQKSLARDIQVQ